jgi:hypothetical protein
MRSSEINKLKKRILAGIDLAFKKLVETKSKEDGELVFSKDGKIVRVKARELQST